MKLYFTSHLFLFTFMFIGCSQVDSDQKAILLQTKGLSCDAVLNDSGELLFCGETSTYAQAASKEKSGKNAYILQTNMAAKQYKLFSYSIETQNVRFEQICPLGADRYISGNFGEDRNKLICKLNNQQDIVWAQGSNQYKTIDKGDMAVDAAGNCLLPTKDPSSDAYEACLHLFDANGTCKWSRKLSAVEVWQDVIVLNNQKFMISYKQKGAYINGELRKKYWINTFQMVDPKGELMQYRNFHFDYDLITDWHFNKLIQDKAGNLYFIGKIEYRISNRTEAFIVKTTLDGRILWSQTYAANNGTEYVFKNACFNASGNLMIVGDGYSKKGGLIYLEMSPDGKVIWANLKQSAYFDQVVSILAKGKNYQILWDKLLNLASFTINAKGESCSNDVQSLQFNQKAFAVLLNENVGAWTPVEADWKPIQIHKENQEQIPVENACK